MLPAIERSLARIRELVPLWEENREAIVALDTRSREFVRYYFADTDCVILGRTYQQFVTAFFAELVFTGFVEEHDNLAELFNYRHIESLKEWASLDDESDAESSKQRLVEAIDD